MTGRFLSQTISETVSLSNMSQMSFCNLWILLSLSCISTTEQKMWTKIFQPLTWLLIAHIQQAPRHNGPSFFVENQRHTIMTKKQQKLFYFIVFIVYLLFCLYLFTKHWRLVISTESQCLSIKRNKVRWYEISVFPGRSPQVWLHWRFQTTITSLTF